MTDGLRFWHEPGRFVIITKDGLIGWRWRVYDSQPFRFQFNTTGTLRHMGWHLTQAGARRTAIRACHWSASWEQRSHHLRRRTRP